MDFRTFDFGKICFNGVTHVNLGALNRDSRLNTPRRLHLYPRNLDAPLEKQLVKALAAIPECVAFPQEVDVAAVFCVETGLFGWKDNERTDGDTAIDSADPSVEDSDRVKGRVEAALKHIHDKDSVYSRIIQLVEATKVNVYTNSYHTAKEGISGYAAKVGAELFGLAMSPQAIEEMKMMGH